jgi:threonine dehydratase
MRSLSHADVLRAAAILDGVANRTPVFTSRSLDERLGASLFFKAEHLQRGGAFKFRGAYHTLSRLAPEARSRGVLTWSSGNHAGGLALAGRLFGMPVTVVMPDDAMALKRAAVLGYGAEVISCPAAERETVGRGVAAERGLTVIPPYDHEDIIAGQGTAALELLAQAGRLDILLAPVGGGGLLSGTALAAGDGPGRPRVYGVEPAIADDAARSFRSGKIVVLDRVPMTIADGLRTRFLGEKTFAVIRERVTDILTVSEEEIVTALRWLWLRMKLVVEPSGAVPLAALLAGRLPIRGMRVGLILSGGNADPKAVGERIMSAEEGAR